MISRMCAAPPNNNRLARSSNPFEGVHSRSSGHPGLDSRGRQSIPGAISQRSRKFELGRCLRQSESVRNREGVGSRGCFEDDRFVSLNHQRKSRTLTDILSVLKELRIASSREVEQSGRVRGNDNVPHRNLPIYFPMRGDGAIGRLVSGVDLANPLIELWLQEDPVETWVVGVFVNASRVAIEPFRDCTVGIMVVGIHCGIAYHLIAIPTFPHGGGSAGDHISPRWIGSLQK